MLAKRVFDIIVSFVGLILLSPVFLLIAIIIKTTSSGPVFFRQVRVGRYGRNFLIHKFRTMVKNAQNIGPQITIGKDKRVTFIGNFLRKTKLDELPQLIDVLRGDMSLVGPRPEVPGYVLTYPSEVKKIVLSVRPGITDWASIKMIDENLILAKSSDPTYTYQHEILPQKLDYALKYVKTRNFIQDLVIIFATLGKILFRKLS